ncbi:DUF547 domain-containing protein [Halofilum ochraceum]|uniref:DUF547 domain-containing protein n=1 Tax=Halofilum ochraceum TaxID=1611323 RepID=UPI0008DACDD2|nr:DUF547 domain-containing protein [Halofilum ochraceum]
MKRLIHGLLVFGLLATHPAAAAPEADLWERWTAHDETSTETIDHSAWTGFLGEYLQEDAEDVTRLDYGGVDQADQQRLDRYIERLAGVPISDYSRSEQFAYWVNLYNAVTVDVVLEHYPVESIRDIDISPGWFSSGPWGAKLVTVEGEELSLDDIEHRILRPIWSDPRIHYAVNCASVGCPDLQPQAFTPENMEKQLDRAARGYVNDSRGFTIDQNDDLIVSSIYEWFQEDFGGSELGVIKHLQKYADESGAAMIERRTEYDSHRYDWSLNDVQ